MGADRHIDSHVRLRAKLLLAPAHLDAREPPVDPSPLDAGEVTHDAKQWDEPSIGSPSGLCVIQAIQIAQHGSAQVIEPLQQHLLLILAARRKAYVVMRHARNCNSGTLGGLGHSAQAAEEIVLRRLR